MTAKKALPKTVQARLQSLPGSARQKIDPKTGIVYSRWQYEKGRKPQPRKNAPAITRKYKQYIQIRDSFIEKEAQKGKKITRREAMRSDKLKTVIKKLHSKKALDKKWALEQTTRGDKVLDWTPYIKRWSEGKL